MSVNQKLYYIFHYFVNPVRITSTHGLSYLSVYKFNNIIFNASETSRTDKNSKNLVYPQRSSHLLCIMQVRSYYFKKLVLATFKSSCTISRAKDFVCSSRVLKAVWRKWGIWKWMKKPKHSFKLWTTSRDIPLCLANKLHWISSIVYRPGVSVS